jgi:hypothetical protein
MFMPERENPKNPLRERAKAGPGFGSEFVRPLGNCICPNCGYFERKLIGVPCNAKRCPECGSILSGE